MTRCKHTETVPLSILDGSDGELVVTFDWSPGTPATGMSGPPEYYDPGSDDEFEIEAAHYESAPGIPVLLAPHEAERMIDWLDEHWERPDDGPDPDWLRDMQQEDRLLQEAEAQFSRGESDG